MLKNRDIMMILVFLALSTGLFSKPRSVGDSTFSFTAELGLGYNTDVNTLLTEIQFQNFSPSLRILWKPDHRLNIGLQTARINIMDIQKNETQNEFGRSDIHASLKGYPALLIINMNLYGIGLYGGLGTTYVTSSIEAMNSRVNVNNWYYTYYLGIGYNYYFSDSFGIGFEADIYTFSLMQVRSGGLKLKLNYDFLNW